VAIEKLTVQRINRFINDCKKQKKTKILGDGGNLYIRATAAATASWIFRYERDGRSHEMGLGSVATFSLDEARERARKCRQMLDEGRDPIAERAAHRAIATTARQPMSKTFRWCAEQYAATHAAGWRNPKHEKDWRASLVRYAYPAFSTDPDDLDKQGHAKGDLLMSAITTERVLQALRPHWQERTETLMRVRQRIEVIWNWARVQGYCSGSTNPCVWKGHLDHVLSVKVRAAKKHFAALGHTEIHALLNDLEAVGTVVADALRFAIMTVSRTKEVRLAPWSEFDLDNRIWTIPPERMKAEREHRVPLTDSAMAILEKLYAVRTASPYVFTAGTASKPLSNNAMLALLKTLRPAVTVHGTCRAAFSTWCSEETSYATDLREAVLAHQTDDETAAAYNRGDKLQRRRELMTVWERFCLTPPDGNVTRLPITTPADDSGRAAS
jgi:integrase